MNQIAPPDSAIRSQGWRERVRSSRLGTGLVLTVTAIVVLAAAYLADRSRGGDGTSPVTLTGASTGAPPTIGEPAQDFAVTTVDGVRTSLGGYQGHPVWLTFGATWCAACRAEAPDIQAAYQRSSGSGVVVLAMFISEDAATVRDYARRVGLTYVLVADPDTTVASAYRVLGIPVHFFIDRAGILRAIRTGSLSQAQMDAALAAISG